MTLCVYLDENIPKQVESIFLQYKFKVHRAMQGVKDRDLFDDCKQKGCILITKDMDFKSIEYKALKGLIILRGKDKHIVSCFGKVIQHIRAGAWMEVVINQNCSIKVKNL